MFMASVIGHRGCAGHAPENTLAGIRDAARLGCTWVEADATLLKDGTVVLFHDDRLERCSNGNGFIRDLTWEQAQALDVGQWFGDGRFAGERMALLKDAIACCSDLRLGFNIELKPHGAEGEALGEAVAACVDVQDNLLVSSFDLGALRRFHSLRPDIPTGLLFESLPKNWQETAKRLRASTVHLWAEAVTPENIQDVNQSGLSVYCYTVNAIKEAKRLMDMGVAGVFSDVPDQVKGMTR